MFLKHSVTLSEEASTEKLLKTPLYDCHKESKGRMVPFAGYEMPVQYSGLLPEHKAVREAVGIFDVSHMGEIVVTGRGALKYLQKMTTNDIDKLEVGQAQYSALLYENGTFVDDIIIYRRGLDSFLICVNAANQTKDFAWLEKHKPDSGVILEDVSHQYAQIAVQGPKALELVQKVVDIPISGIKYYRFAEGKVLGAPSIIARTGYTGELGYELYVPSQEAPKIWRGLLEAGQEFGVLPCGLGCRDTLRLEVAFHLYGQDMDDSVTALEAGLGWIVKVDKGEFIGRDVLVKQKEEGLKKRLVAFEVNGRGIARHGYKVFLPGGTEEAGIVTSGTRGPSVEKAIGLAYVPTEHAKIGNTIEIENRGKRFEATLVKKPFYTEGTATKGVSK